MPNLIRALQGDIDRLRAIIAQDAELLLKSIDLERLLEDPDYILELSREFIQQHLDEIREAVGMGEKFANAVLTRKALKS